MAAKRKSGADSAGNYVYASFRFYQYVYGKRLGKMGNYGPGFYTNVYVAGIFTRAVAGGFQNWRQCYQYNFANDEFFRTYYCLLSEI